MRRLSLIIILFLIISTSGCKTSDKVEVPKDPSVLYKEAEEKLKKGDYDEARESFKAVMERDAEKSLSPIAQIRTADSFYDEGKFNDAIDEYKKFLSLYPHNKYAGYVQYQIGMSHFRQIEGVDRGHEHIRSAIKELESFLRNYPRSTFVDEAKEKLRLCRDKAAGFELYVGNFYYKKGSYNAAVSRFEDIIKKYPQSSYVPEALYHLGLSYVELGNTEKAKEFLNILTNRFPDYKYKRDADRILSRLNEKR